MLLFYILFAIFFIAVRVLNFSPQVLLLLSGCIAVCESSMFFLAGRDVAQKKALYTTEHADGSVSGMDTFRIALGKKALFLFILYAILGIPCLWHFKQLTIYGSIRNILAFNIVPDQCGILASLAFLYIIAAAFAPYFITLDSKKRWRLAIIISILGFLLIFLPRRIFGYALIGIFLGGDKFGCVPIATHLLAFFWGMYTISPGKLSLKDRWNLIIIILLAGFTLCTGVFRLRYAFYLGAGTLGAFFAVAIASLFLPLFGKLSPIFIRCRNFLKETVITLDEPAKGKVLSKTNARSLIIYFLGYTALFLITALFVFLPILQMGKSLVWTGDALSQYIPKLHRFLNYIPQIFGSLASGNPDFPVYDYSSGLGSTMSITFEPIYWLYLILPKGNIDAVYTFLTLFRFFLAGVSFSLLLIYFRRSFLASWTASMAYTFSGFALFAGTRHFTFIVSLILLPMLIVGMERLIRHRKWYLFTVAVALSLLCSYYFLYMNTIVLGLYYISRILCTKEYRNLKTFFGRGLIIAGSYILGCSMGVLSIATHFGSYLSSGRSQGDKLSALLAGFSLFYRQGWISDVFLSSINYSFSPGFWLKIGTVPLAFLGAVLLFTRKNSKELRIMFLLLTAFTIFPVAAFIFSGFSSITNRWCYIYSVLTAFLAALCLDQMHNLTRKDIFCLTAVTVYYGVLLYFDERLQFSTIYADLAFLALTLCIILLLNTKDIRIPRYAGKIMLGILTIMVLVYNGSHFVTEKSDDGELHIDYTKFDSYEQLSKTSLKDLNQIPEYKDSEEFFRSTTMKGSNNTNCFSLVNGHNDLSTFSSTLNGSVVDYNRMMGNSGWTLVRVMDYNFRTIMNELACVRYLGFDSEKFQTIIPYGYEKVYTSKEGLPIYENKYVLPLGYTYDTVLPDSFALDKDAVTRQDLTMNAAIIDDDKIDECSNLKQELSVPLTSHEIPAQIEYDGIHIEGGKMYFDKEGASIKLHFESEPNSETYVVYKGKITEIDDGDMDYRSVIIKAKDIKYTYGFRTDSYKTDQDQFVFNLGYRTDQIKACKLTFKLQGCMDFEDLKVYSQPMDHYEEMVNARREDILEDVSIDNNTITGKIDLSSDKMLIIALPLQGGWTAYVDDKEVPIYRANYQYMGLNISKGSHKVRLHYKIAGLRPALMVTASGLTVFILIIIFNAVRKRRKKNS